jgi:hypothetical protein
MTEGRPNGEEIYFRVPYTQALQEVRLELHEANKKLDALVAQDLPGRVRKLELRFYGIIAGLIGGTGGAGIVGYVIGRAT